MKNTKQFPFNQSRRITRKEVDTARKAIEQKTGEKRKGRGRPKKPSKDKYVPISIRLHPKVLAWAKKQAKEKKIGYQNIINDVLLKKSS